MLYGKCTPPFSGLQCKDNTKRRNFQIFRDYSGAKGAQGGAGSEKVRLGGEEVRLGSEKVRLGSEKVRLGGAICLLSGRINRPENP